MLNFDKNKKMIKKSNYDFTIISSRQQLISMAHKNYTT